MPRRVRPAIDDKSYVSELKKFDEFPNRTCAANSFFFITKILYKNETTKYYGKKKSPFTGLFFFITI